MAESTATDASVNGASSEDEEGLDVPGVSATLGQMQEELSRLKAATDHIEESRKAAEEAVQAAEKLSSSSKELGQATEGLVGRIEEINFPSRFDKLDATISSVNQGTQNVQSRLDRTESTIKEGIKQAHNNLQKKQKALAGKVKDLAQEIQTVKKLLYVAILVAAIAALMPLFVV